MKKIIYFFVGCILVGLTLSFIFGTIPVFPTSAKGFLLSLKQGHDQEAYDLMSDKFRSEYDLSTFKKFVEKNELNKYQSSIWTKTYTSPDKTEGFVMGTMTTTTGKQIPIKIDFIMTEGKGGWLDKQWRIKTIEINPLPETS